MAVKNTNQSNTAIAPTAPQKELKILQVIWRMLTVFPRWVWTILFRAAESSRELRVKDVPEIVKQGDNWYCTVRRGGHTVRERLPPHINHISDERKKHHLDMISERLCKRLDKMLPRGKG